LQRLTARELNTATSLVSAKQDYRFGQRLPGKSARLLFGQILVFSSRSWFDATPRLTLTPDLGVPGVPPAARWSAKPRRVSQPGRGRYVIPKFIEIIAPDGLGSEHYQTVIYGQSLSSLAAWVR
jgi:hypothetical protein